ncbi:hypothetical protein HK102_005717 [Quaeritorhiza haematococci]|nr:hypothetical protein HK102_005717 [Quaeritorhiza haematococci]
MKPHKIPVPLPPPTIREAIAKRVTRESAAAAAASKANGSKHKPTQPTQNAEDLNEETTEVTVSNKNSQQDDATRDASSSDTLESETNEKDGAGKQGEAASHAAEDVTKVETEELDKTTEDLTNGKGDLSQQEPKPPCDEEPTPPAAASETIPSTDKKDNEVAAKEQKKEGEEEEIEEEQEEVILRKLDELRADKRRIFALIASASTKPASTLPTSQEPVMAPGKRTRTSPSPEAPSKSSRLDRF